MLEYAWWLLGGGMFVVNELWVLGVEQQWCDTANG